MHLRLPIALALEYFHRFLQGMSLPVKRLVAPLKRRDRFRLEPAPLESLAIDAARTRRITVRLREPLSKSWCV